MQETIGSKQHYNDAAWMQEGNCHVTKAGRFLSDLFIYESKGIMRNQPERVREALKFCAECPVAEICLDYGQRTNKNHFAIYGGHIISPKGNTIDI